MNPAFPGQRLQQTVNACGLPSLTCSYTRDKFLPLRLLLCNILTEPFITPMPIMGTLTTMAADRDQDDVSPLQTLLHRKLANIPKNHLPALAATDILDQTPRAVQIVTLPPDLQLPIFLRNRTLINRDNERPIKDEDKQPLKITRAIFFYHLNETYQFQRFHDTCRWNLALFTALLWAPDSTSMCLDAAQSSRRSAFAPSEVECVTPAARRFMTGYLAGVLERHNTPTVFDKREEFIKRWKNSNIDLFVSFKAAQAKLLKKTMQRLTGEWEDELDKAMRWMGKIQYEARVAPFVGSIIPGRKDQGLPVVQTGVLSGFRDFTRSSSPSPEARKEMDMELDAPMDGKNELLEALQVPLEERDYKRDDRYEEETRTPADVRYAIASMQNVRPSDILPALIRLFPVQVEEGGRDGDASV
jgi:hypothetical protein